MRRLSALLVVLAAAAPWLAACGGDGSDQNGTENVITSIGGKAPGSAEVKVSLGERGIPAEDVPTDSLGANAKAGLLGAIAARTKHGRLTLYWYQSVASAQDAYRRVPGNEIVRYGVWVVTGPRDVTRAEVSSLRLKPILDPVPPGQAQILGSPSEGE